MNASTALERLRTLGPVFRSKDAVTAGVAWRDLYALRDAGELLELSRGLFQVADMGAPSHPDFVAVCARAPHGMICLDSALAYWDLSDDIPDRIHLAVPEGTHRPAIDYPPTQVHVFQAASFNLGRLEQRGGHAERFWVSDRERTVVDAFRLRHRMGEEVAHAALRRYLQGRAQPARLSDYARALRVWGPVTGALRVLQA